MQDSMIWISSPHPSGAEQKYIDDAFNTRRLLTLGENVDGFEADIEKYLGNNVHVAALSSGTAAIHMALVLLDVGPGDEVICQSLTFAASANPVVYLGGTPVFVDSEPQTWNICPDALESAIKNRIAAGKQPKAIVAVHAYGMPYKVREIRELADKYGIPVVEDSAEALGSAYYSQKCGTFGDLSILSFNGNKIITTSSGGVLVSKSAEMKQRAIFLASQAKDAAPHYQHSQIGYNYRMSNVLAGIGRGQAEVLEERIIQRRSNHDFYKNLFAPIHGVSAFTSIDDEAFFSNYWLTAVVLENNGDNMSLMQHLLLDSIDSRPVFKPLHLQPVFSQCLYFGGNRAETIFNSGLCLPSSSNLSAEQKERIEQSVYKWDKAV
ncbi:MAG: aminotransferase class I/II-fold pyridoxal phosphate-dependent enzyme [Bacteroidota bacterium]